MSYNKFWTEKYQTILPGLVDNGDSWITADAVRHNSNAQLNNRDNSVVADLFAKFNKLPPGMAIEGDTKFVYGFGGDTDVTNTVTADSIKNGFEYSALAPTDDQYGGEHIEAFYGDAIGDDGRVGFVERNNYLDRM